MAKAIATIKVMPETPDQDRKKITDEVVKFVIDFAGDTDRRIKEEPIAFGLVAIVVTFVVDEAKGGLEPLMEKIEAVHGVSRCELSDWRRAIG